MALIHWWPLNGDTNDYIGGKHGILAYNGTVSEIGKIGKCYSSNTTFSSNSNCPDGVAITQCNLIGEIGSEYSFACWIKVHGSQSRYEGTIISSGDWNVKNGWTFGISQSNKTIYTPVHGADAQGGIEIEQPLSNNVWYHIATVYNNGKMTLYINGNEKGTIEGAAGIYTSSSAEMYIGRDQAHGGFFPFNGDINDVRIYDYALSLTEVKFLAQGLIAHYPLKASFLPNLLEGAEKYTKEEPLVRHADITTGNLRDSYIYHDNITINISRPGRYIFVLNSDGMPRNHDIDDVDNTIENRKYMICFRHKTSGVHPIWKDFQIAEDGRHYGFLDFEVGNYELRTNLYIYNQTGNYTVKLWDMQLFEYNQYIPVIFETVASSRKTRDIYTKMGLDKSFTQDVSGYKNHLTSIGSINASNASPAHLTSCNFDGQNYLYSYCSTYGQNDLTISAWVYPHSNFTTSERSCIVIGGAYLTLVPVENNKAKIYTYFYGKSNPGYHGSNGTIDIEKWSHIVVTWDETQKKHYIYINGKCDTTIENCNGPSSWTESSDLLWHNRKYIGREVWWNSDGSITREFNGLISDVRIYTTAFSANDVADLYSIKNINPTIAATELIESSPIDVINNSKPLVASNFTELDAPLSNMKIKTLPDRTAWARIHNLDLTEKKSSFIADEVNDCDVFGKYSKMGLVDGFKNSNYEFMLTYPSMQTALPNEYTQLEYVESDGRQYLSTGVTDKARWEFDIQFKKQEALIPKMTSNTTPYGEVLFECDSSVTLNTQEKGYLAFDSDTSTQGDITYGKGYDPSIKVGYQFKQPVPQIKLIKLHARLDAGASQLISGAIEYKKAGSNNWHVAVELTSNNFTNSQFNNYGVNLQNVTAIRAYGYGAANSGINYGFIIFELQAYSGTRQLMGYGGSASEYWGVQPQGNYGLGETWGLLEVQAGKRDTLVHCYGEDNIRYIRVQDKQYEPGWTEVSAKTYLLFALSTSLSYACYAKLYGCNCIQNKQLIRKFVPALRNSDNIAGLYDLVNNQFYTSASGTHLLAGPKIKKVRFLDYLESTGTQYINTGIKYDNTSKYETYLKLSYSTIESTNQILGFTGNRGMGVGPTTNNTWWETTESSASPPQANQKYDIYWYKEGANYQRKINSNIVSQGSNGYNNVADANMLLFAAHTSYNTLTPDYFCKIKLYSATIYVDDILTREYVPAMDETGKVGMFDLVENKFYTNDGSGEFVISNYTQLEYIESTGTQYINTGVAPSSTLETEISFIPTGGLEEHAIFGSTWAANGYFLMFYHNQIRWHSGGQWEDIGNYSAGERVVCHCTNSYIIVNGVYYSIEGGENTANQITILDNMGYSPGGKGIGKIEYVKMWENGRLIKNFIPIRYSNGQIGLYDLIGKTFYGNLGSGVFGAGPEIKPELQLPIVNQYNRWIQTNSPNVNYRQSTGYQPIHTDFCRWNGSKYSSGPITKSFDQERSVYLVSESNDPWAPIGQKELYGSGIRALNNTTQYQVELWVRVDKAAEATEIKINDGCYIAPQFIEY